MIKFWILTISIFLIITYFLHKAFYKRIKGEIQMRNKIFSIYYWEGLVAMGSLSTLALLLILKSTNLITF